ncbi:hypothetical protein [Hymenobacter coccineus]|nr:hypothetical protein [Hymenobacter coccineus]
MSHPYLAFEASSEVNGATIQLVLAACLVPHIGTQLLTKHGLPAQPQAEEWYPLQAWLDVLADLEQRTWEDTIYAAGLRAIDLCVWPPNLHTLSDALAALEQACRANIRGQNIGYYQVDELGPHEARVRCLTPTPAEFERGILTGLARRYQPARGLRVRVEPEPTPPNAPRLLKWFRVSW